MYKITRAEWVELVGDLRFAIAYGCIADKPIPLDERELLNMVRSDTRQCTVNEYAGWLAGDTCEETT